MFEIPDDDEEFWETLPLEDNLPQCNTSSQDEVESKKSFVAKHQPKKDATLPASLDTDGRSLVVPFQGQNQDLQKTAVAGIKGMPVLSENPAHDMLKPDGAETLHDIFNLTQSSNESELELSLTIQNETGPKPPEEEITVKKASLETGYQQSLEFGAQNKRIIASSASSEGVFQMSDKVGCDSPNYRNKAMYTGRSNTLHEVATSINVSALPPKGCTWMGQPERKSVSHIQKPHVDANRVDLIDVNSKTKRKFPGPAGLLPKLVPGQDLQSEGGLVSNPPKSPKKQDVPIGPSQSSTEDVFHEAPWQMLQQDLGDDCQLILKKFSIADTVTKARLKQLPNGKVPLLFVVVETLDIQGTDGFVVLRDKTGKMQGTAHRELLKESELQFQQGVALVLKQVGVISPSQRTHYLNITPSNVVSVYRSNGDGTARVTQEETENLLQVVSAVETQLTQTQSISAPRVGQLLSLPGTPIHSVLQSPTLFQNVRSSPTVSQSMPRLGSSLAAQSGQLPSKADQVFKVPQLTPLTPCRAPSKPSTSQLTHTSPQVPYSPAHMPRAWISPNMANSDMKHLQPSLPSTPPLSLSPLASVPAVRPTLPARGYSDNCPFPAQPHYQQPSQHNVPVPQHQILTPALRDSGGQSSNKKTASRQSPSGSNTPQRSPLQAIPTYATLPNSSDSSQQSHGNATPEQCSKSKWTFKSKRSPGVSSSSVSTGVISNWQWSSSVVSQTSVEVGKKTSLSVQLPAKLRAKASSPSFIADLPPSKSRRPNFTIDETSFALDAGHQHGHRSAFSPGSFKEVSPCDTPLELNTSLAGRNPAEMNIDSLWPDDLTDEFLTELTADDFLDPQ